ncbi:recombinase family protein [Promicromonospora sukumoe]|uniref:recombinase family protein n=1 Tax=Promicromonospora sukumoe TaxID=88382 RepID=UPI0015FE188D|nr:recombinase family protein [Promicromonospora sukumoe]
MDLAFLGRVSTEDAQDPTTSRMWQLKRARDLVEPMGHRIVAEFFDVGQSRSLPWKRRPEANALLEEIKRGSRRFDGVVVGEPQRAFYGHQFAMTFPVLTHYKCALFVPEVGGQVDPDSEAHEIMMGLFGGMSKSERSRIKKRTAASMRELAAHTDRHLGGRPPYGYRSIDIGPHPNPAKAAAGQRAHKLSPDPVTAPVIERIFAEFIAGKAVRAITAGLVADDIPSPSAYDPARNSHRDQRGWAHQTVRAILLNPTYTGYRVWGKQEKFEQLMNVEDVAAGEVTRMRWRGTDQWIRPDSQTHPAIVDIATYEKALARINAQRRGANQRSPKTSSTGRVYPLAGRCFCTACESRLSARFYASKKKDGTGRVLYRCDVGGKRALPTKLAEHPVAGLNQNRVLPVLDSFLFELFDEPAALAATMAGGNPGSSQRAVAQHKQIAETKKEIENLVRILAGGLTSEAITTALVAKEAELKALQRQLDDLQAPGESIDVKQLAEDLQIVGGSLNVLGRATDEERRDLYEALGVRVDFNAAASEVVFSVNPLITGRYDKSVRRGT